ncbi:MAG: alpha/beta hydrolase-fold protein [Proteobacteria bacterium]|nr:alpha/beta hydrolase-fold protein [Pseudomonadota bacterium]
MIPWIDQNYRTIAERKGRCIEGHSMGGRGATRLAMKYPNLFCSLFNQSGNVPRTLEGFDPSARDEYPNNYLGPDRQNYVDNDAFELLKKNLSDISGKLRIQMWCGTADTDHLPTIRSFHQALVEAGVDHTYLEIEGLGHGKKPIIERYRDIWFDHHVESLRQAGGNGVSGP